MKQGLTSTPTRNLMVFEAPKELAEKTKEIAAVEMVSASAICRRALNDYIISAERKTLADSFLVY